MMEDAVDRPRSGAEEKVRSTLRGQSASQQSIELRLRRLEGQIRGIQNMLEVGADCEAILVQLAAVAAGVRSAGVCILKNHIRNCLVTSPERDRSVIADEITVTVQRFCKSLR